MHRFAAPLVACCLILPATPLRAAASDTVDQPHVRASLVTEHQAVTPGRPFTVGLLLQADEHWHTYWRNPGESGLPTKIQWTLPDGFTAGDIHWPTPTRFETAGPIVNFGYEGPVLLMVDITPPDTLDADRVTLTARASWLVCDPNACLPGSATLSVEVPVSESGAVSGMEIDPATADHFAQARAALPQPVEPGRVRIVSRDVDAVTFAVTLDETPDDVEHVTFFPADGGLFETVATVKVADGSLLVTVTAFNPNQTPHRLHGVLTVPGRSLAIDLKLPRDE